MLPRGAINPVTICCYLCSLPLQAVGQAAAPSKPPHPARGGRRGSCRRRPSYGAARRRGRRGRRATAVEAAVALALPAQPAGHGRRRVSQQVSSAPYISDRRLKRIIHVALAILLTSIRQLLLLANSPSRICNFLHIWHTDKAKQLLLHLPPLA